MKISLLLSLLLISASFILAQDSVLLTSGKTVEGKVIIDLPETGYEKIRVKSNDGKYSFKAHEFISFRKGDQKYVTLKLDQKYRIMKAMNDGYLSLYYYREGEAYDFNTKYLHKKDGTGVVVPTITFKKVMLNFLKDCPQVVKDLDNDQYKRNDIETLITDYNNCIDSNTIKAKLNLKEVANTENPAIELIDNLMMTLDGRNKELITLLKDIQTKVVQDQPVPGYLKSALKEQTANLESIKSEVAALLNSI